MPGKHYYGTRSLLPRARDQFERFFFSLFLTPGALIFVGLTGTENCIQLDRISTCRMDLQGLGSLCCSSHEDCAEWVSLLAGLDKAQGWSLESTRMSLEARDPIFGFGKSGQ